MQSDFCKLIFFRKGVFTQTAYGANPVLGNILPRGSGSYAVIGISHCGIVNIATGAYIFYNTFI